MKNRVMFICILFVSVLALPGCGGKDGAKDDDDASNTEKGKIEVKVTSPRIGTIAQYETLNASTVYQLNDAVRAPIAGYIKKINVAPGQIVKQGDVLFSMQTKEAAALGSMNDSLFPAKGAILVKATEAGVVKTLTRQVGDYMQDGDELCTIANNASLVFMLDVPYEMRKYVREDRTYTITLPDGGMVQTHITSQVPEMDKTVQMQRFILHSSATLNLPEGLIGTIAIPTTSQANATILPKAAVLSNEAQTQFWLMKLIHDSVAVKVDIEKGIETKDSLQVKSPTFNPNDRILISGNYGLADTVLVKIAGAK
ncbi:MAG TPA: HlyD family efflux transporter periplasmic adaptor subunit [Bacteroidia bacterium]|nr:HlyD family efflux transporter periplasmic adaptor subunit [Bacteroidia bacterium]